MIGPCRVCGGPAHRLFNAGPIKVVLCDVHGLTVGAGAAFLKLIIG